MSVENMLELKNQYSGMSDAELETILEDNVGSVLREDRAELFYCASFVGCALSSPAINLLRVVGADNVAKFVDSSFLPYLAVCSVALLVHGVYSCTGRRNVEDVRYHTALETLSEKYPSFVNG